MKNKFRKNTHKFRKNTHKLKNVVNKNIKKTLFFKGGNNAIKHYYLSNEPTSRIPLTVDDSEIIERIFNPLYSELTWKQPSHSDISQTVQPYNAYNTIDSISYPIFFKELPSQIPGKLYVPIYVYRSVVMPLDHNISTTMDEIMRVYSYITDLLLKTEWSACLDLVHLCPLTSGLKSRAHRACCGFIAPALAIMLHYRNRIDKDGKTITPFDTELAMRMGINFYANYTGYGSSTNSWNKNCDRWSYTLKQGVNILTFYDRVSVGEKICMTYHHFIVYVKNDYSIIIDAWAGSGGFRGEWSRIMKTENISEILIKISATISLETTNQLLNQYFIVPHSIDIDDNIDRNWQTNLLSVGAYNLETDNWENIMTNLQEFSKQNKWIETGGRK